MTDDSHTESIRDRLDRREFLKVGAAGMGAALAGTAASPSPAHGEQTPQIGTTFGTAEIEPLERVRVGFVGLGHQGPGHVRNFLNIPGTEVRALCDLVPEKVERVQQMVVNAGHPEPTGYSGSHEAFRRLCGEEELDLVFSATPWRWHAPVLIEAMENGKHAATEIPMCISVEECWQIIEVSERTNRHCVPMENCCYDRVELMIFNIVRQGLFGELLHAECGYLHDLRELKLSDYYEEEWRIKHSIARNADLYPTHGLGPVSQWMDINRGNRFDHLVSMATQSRGLNLYASQKYGADSPQARQTYALGDVVNTLIQTHRGQTILITHDTDSPRPYSRKVMLQGTRGVVRKYPEQLIHIEGRSRGHRWEDLADYAEEFEHPLWRATQERSRGAGHGGMDYIEDYRLVQCLLEGKPTDMDVYDGAAWSAVIELSERSIAGGGQPMDFPEFTRGAWRTRAPLEIVSG
jgi:hypothetical protein